MKRRYRHSLKTREQYNEMLQRQGRQPPSSSLSPHPIVYPCPPMLEDDHCKVTNQQISNCMSTNNNNNDSTIDHLRNENEKLRKEKNEALLSVKSLHEQQLQLYEKFQLLHEKYNDLKSEMYHVLWEYIPSSMSSLSSLPSSKSLSSSSLLSSTSYPSSQILPTMTTVMAEYADSEDQHANTDNPPASSKDFFAHVNHAVFETSDRIHDYMIGPLLGKGQFANVNICTLIHDESKQQNGQHYAVKIMPKRQITTLACYQRVHNEINLLQQLDHPNIISYIDFINSPKCLYLITELAHGKDLYEFFEANPSGVCNNVSRQIVLGIVNALVYLHSYGICHLDLKPENVLLCEEITSNADINENDIDDSQSTSNEKPSSASRPNTSSSFLHQINVKICDFGQSTMISCQDLNCLSDLCGSPGFFAPEMILNQDDNMDDDNKSEVNEISNEGDIMGKSASSMGNAINGYNGFAADVWSLGCIMLELTRGHDDFCKLWMVSYDYDIIQDSQAFEISLKKAVAQLNQRHVELLKLVDVGKDESFIGSNYPHLAVEVDLDRDNTVLKQHLYQSDFLNKLLVIDPKERIKSSEMLDHPWLCEQEQMTHKELDSKSSINYSSCTNSEESPYRNQEESKSDKSRRKKMFNEYQRMQTRVTLTRRRSSSTPPPRKGKKCIFRDSLSARARKHLTGSDEKGSVIFHDDKLLQDCNNVLSVDESPSAPRRHSHFEIRLPPLDPSLKSVEQSILEGDRIITDLGLKYQ